MKTSTVLKKFSMTATGSAAYLALSTFSANAVSVVRIPQSSFTPQAGLITFSEFSLGTVNPTYTPVNYGGNPLTAPTVTFGGFYQGQSLSATPGVDCPGGAATGCVVGTPTGPLSLNPAYPNTFITTDVSNPTSPVLSGTPRFNGPITILFDKDMAGVGLDGGFFDAPNSTAITAFARNGSVLGQVSNTGLGIEFLGLVTSDGSAAIAGLQFSLIGPEPAGFAIDSLRFGLPGQVNPPQKTPEPASLLGLLTIGVLGAGSALKRKLK
jgi:hypothetical protein